jgi:4-amino-4-deoxy-L-arabinose transferase-like glycosyltransferase
VPTDPRSAPARDPVLRAWAALHALLVLFALWAWIAGPFRGAGVLDGAEVLRLAREGASGTFETKSPLVPALVAAAFALAGDSPWTVGLFGLACSLATLAAVAALAREVDPRPRAARWAVGLYALSGSALVYAVQPLPAGCATALLAWGVLALARATRGGATSAALAAGALLAGAALARAPLALAGAAALACALRVRPRAVLTACGAALACALLAAAVWGERAWPGGAWFNLRLGNGGMRSGICDVRPGPEYDRLRIQAAFAPAQERGAAPDFEAFHARALARELRADPAGAAATLARKAYLFLQRTETVSAADFHHGLARLPIAPLLLAAFGLVAPLALCGLARAPRRVLLAPWLALFAVNVLWMTCARYRFPALPFACAAAGAFVASRPGARAWAACALLGLALNANLSGRALRVPGDGLVQEGRLELARDRSGDAVRRAYAAAFAAGSRDARAHYELALALEAEGPARDVAGALAQYAAALALAPDYAEAAENQVALLLREARVDEARALCGARPPELAHAGKIALNLAALERERGLEERALALDREGLAALALRALAGGDMPLARRWAREAAARGARDPRIALLLAP